MCGRFHSPDLDDIRDRYEIKDLIYDNGTLQQDCFPGAQIPVIAADNEDRQLLLMQWGFAMQGKKQLVYNARSETLRNSRMFQLPYRNGRCIVPALYFYEWFADENGKKHPVEFVSHEIGMFGMGGVYNSAGQVAVITCAATPPLSRIHDRMPLLIPYEYTVQWLQAKDMMDVEAVIAIGKNLRYEMKRNVG